METHSACRFGKRFCASAASRNAWPVLRQLRVVWSGCALVAVLFSSIVNAQRAATATPTVVNGFLVALTVLDTGEGYSYTPRVTITGGGGQGATAVAKVLGGAVVSISVASAGNGYITSPDVIIDPPGFINLSSLEIDMVPRLTIHGQPGATNEIQYTTRFMDSDVWAVLTNIWMASNTVQFYDTISPKGSAVFYRAVVDGGLAAPPGFVWIQPGHFVQGSPPSDLDQFGMTEQPQTGVTLTKGFYMCSHEVTQSEYQTLVGANPSYVRAANRPVDSVTWMDATNYCHLLTAKERLAGKIPLGWSYRLPTEAEWEYAARAGTSTRFPYGDDPTYLLLGDYAWEYRNASQTSHAVAGKRPNQWGLYDMHGNACEWCSDFYEPYLGGEVQDYRGPSTGTHRVVRGGCWRYGESDCRSARRIERDPVTGTNWIGFRVVLGTNTEP